MSENETPAVDSKLKKDSEQGLVDVYFTEINAKKAHAMQYGGKFGWISALPFLLGYPWGVLLSIVFAVSFTLRISDPDGSSMTNRTLNIVPHYAMSAFVPVYMTFLPVWTYVGVWFRGVV